MENKYQEELDKLKGWSYSFPESQIIKPQLDNTFGLLQELINNYRDCRNELCLMCGKYKNEHLGSCDGCKWHEQH